MAHDSNLAKSDSKVSTTLNESATDHFETQLLEKKTKISPLSESKYTSRTLSALSVIVNVDMRRISFVLTNVYAVTCSLPKSSFPKTTKLPPAVARAPVTNQFWGAEFVVSFSRHEEVINASLFKAPFGNIIRNNTRLFACEFEPNAPFVFAVDEVTHVTAPSPVTITVTIDPSNSISLGDTCTTGGMVPFAPRLIPNFPNNELPIAAAEEDDIDWLPTAISESASPDKTSTKTTFRPSVPPTHTIGDRSPAPLTNPAHVTESPNPAVSNFTAFFATAPPFNRNDDLSADSSTVATYISKTFPLVCTVRLHAITRNNDAPSSFTDVGAKTTLFAHSSFLVSVGNVISIVFTALLAAFSLRSPSRSSRHKTISTAFFPLVVRQDSKLPSRNRTISPEPEEKSFCCFFSIRVRSSSSSSSLFLK
mmetsp:Transcript_6408/g.21418  ORF Transcript_6408/g.21418 Transcript_6408/m.21418 type:complete len:422 (-) Transcript_6408:146-1411(-)